jgi:mannosyltransferase
MASNRRRLSDLRRLRRLASARGRRANREQCRTLSTPSEPTAPDVPTPLRRRRGALFAATLAGLVALGAAVRIYDLGTRDLWLDEANTVVIARQPLPQLIERLQLDSSPPLYYVLLHFWMELFGDHVEAVRSMSVLIGVGLIAAVYVVGARLFSFEVGAIAGLLTALARIQVLHSQQVRMYALLPLTAVLAVFFLHAAATASEPSRRRRLQLAYALATLASLYTHNYAIYTLPAHGLILIVTGSLRARPLSWILTGAGIGIGYLPWLPSLLMQLGNKTHYSWIIPFWQGWGPLGCLERTLDSFSVGNFSLSSVGAGQVEFFPWVPMALFAGLMVWALYHAWRYWRRRREFGGRVVTLAVYVFVPLAAALGASMLSQPNYLPGRCDQLVFPGAVLLVAVGLSRVRPAAARGALLCVLLAYDVAALGAHYGNRPPDGDRVMAGTIAEHAKPGDVVIFTSLIRAPVQYYLEQAGIPLTFYSFPAATARHLGNQDDQVLLQNPEALDREARDLMETVRAKHGPGARVFAVIGYSPVNEYLVQRLLDPSRSVQLAHLGRFRQTIQRQPFEIVLQQLKPTTTAPANRDAAAPGP